MGPGEAGTSLPTQMDRGALGMLQDELVAVMLTQPPVKPAPTFTVSVRVLFDREV